MHRKGEGSRRHGSARRVFSRVMPGREREAWTREGKAGHPKKKKKKKRGKSEGGVPAEISHQAMPDYEVEPQKGGTSMGRIMSVLLVSFHR